MYAFTVAIVNADATAYDFALRPYATHSSRNNHATHVLVERLDLMNIQRRILWALHDIGEALMQWAERKLFESSRILFKS
jgi:hypothetical protein